MTAFRASYADLKVIKTRQCVQVIFELPIEDFDSAYGVLGGLPNSSAERWFGIAALKPGTEVMPNTKRSPADIKLDARPGQDNPPPDRAKRDWRDLSPSQQAGIRCEEPIFAAFLSEKHPDDWHEAGADAAECVRLMCQIGSRSELTTNNRARVIWLQLDEEYAAWKALENA